MANRLFVLCLVCLFGAPAAVAQDGECVVSPDYACLIGYALATAAKIERAPKKAETLRYIARAQTEAGDPEGARATAERIEDAETKAWVLSHVARAQAATGDSERARASFEAARAAAEKIESASKKDETLEYLALIQAKAGDPEGARATAERIEDDHARVLALAGIAAALANRRRSEPPP